MRQLKGHGFEGLVHNFVEKWKVARERALCEWRVVTEQRIGKMDLALDVQPWDDQAAAAGLQFATAKQWGERVAHGGLGLAGVILITSAGYHMHKEQ